MRKAIAIEFDGCLCTDAEPVRWMMLPEVVSESDTEEGTA